MNLPPEIEKAVTNTKYTFQSLDDDDLVFFADILVKNSYKSRKNSYSTGRRYIEDNLKNHCDKLLKPHLTLRSSEIEAESNEIEEQHIVLGSEGMKNIIPSNGNNIWTKSMVLIGLKLSGQTDILTGATNSADEL